MQQTCKIQFDIVSTDPAANLGFEVWLNNEKISDSIVFDSQHIEFQISDDDGDHQMKFVLKNKTDKHTVIDQDGNILSDATIKVQNLKFDEIELGYVLSQLAKYTHNSNGHSEQITQQFFGEMGCNGTVSLEFSTPIYLWLLENM